MKLISAALMLAIAACSRGPDGQVGAMLPNQMGFETLQSGTGPSPTINDVVLIAFKGTLPDGKVFDQQPHAVMPVWGLMPSFRKAVIRMQIGGKYKVHIPASLAYGHKQAGPIPPDSDLNFEVNLIDFKSRETFGKQVHKVQVIKDPHQLN